MGSGLHGIGLKRPEPRVEPRRLAHELLMRASLDEPTVDHADDPGRNDGRRQAMSDDDPRYVPRAIWRMLAWITRSLS